MLDGQTNFRISLTNTSQSRVELRIQDGGPRASKSVHLGKQHTNLDRGPENGLTDFHGDTIVKKSEKTYTIFNGFPWQHNHDKSIKRYLQYLAVKHTEVLLLPAMIRTDRVGSDWCL